MACHLYIIGWMLLYRHMLAEMCNMFMDLLIFRIDVRILIIVVINHFITTVHWGTSKLIHWGTIQNLCISNSWCWNAVLIEGWGGQSCLHRWVWMHCDLLLLSTWVDKVLQVWKLLFIPDCDHLMTVSACPWLVLCCLYEQLCSCVWLCLFCALVALQPELSATLGLSKAMMFWREHGIELCAVMLSRRPACAHHSVFGQCGPTYEVVQCP